MNNTIHGSSTVITSTAAAQNTSSQITAGGNDEKKQVSSYYDSFESSVDVENFNNYTKYGAASAASESERAAIHGKSKLDALYDKLMSDESYTDSYWYKSDNDIAAYTLDKIPDEFRDNLLGLFYEYIREADQDTVKLYFQETMTRYHGNFDITREDDKDGWNMPVWRYAGFSRIEEDYRNYDINDILENGTEEAKNCLRSTVCRMLHDKAISGEGLTVHERAMSPYAAKLELAYGTHGKFENKMAKVAEQINSYFKRNEKSISPNRTFSITFDKDFNFLVSSDSAEESANLRDALSNGNGVLSRIIWSVLFHRQEDGSVNPWVDDPQLSGEVKEYGYANLSEEYVNLINLFNESYEKAQMNEKLSRLFGVTMDDMEYKNGKLTGKNPEAQTAIESSLFKEMDYEPHIRSIINNVTTDDLSFLKIEYSNGKFSLII